jgi:hypothetical protein
MIGLLAVLLVAVKCGAGKTRSISPEFVKKCQERLAVAAEWLMQPWTRIARERGTETKTKNTDRFS